MATTQFLTGVSFLRNGFFSWRTDWPGSTSGSFLRNGFFLFHIFVTTPVWQDSIQFWSPTQFKGRSAGEHAPAGRAAGKFPFC